MMTEMKLPGAIFGDVVAGELDYMVSNNRESGDQSGRGEG